MVEGSGNYLHAAGAGIKRGYQEVKEAGANIREGGPVGANIGKAASGVQEAATSALPLVGPTLGKVREDLFNKNYRGALGGLTGTLLQLLPLSEELRGKAGELGKASPERAAGSIETSLATPAGKGGQRAAAMAQDISDARNDLSQIAQKQPLKSKGAARFHELAEKIDDRQDAIWKEAHKPQVQRWEREPVNHQWVANEAAKSLPTEIEDASPEETAKASGWIEDVLNKPRTLQQLDNLLRAINNDIKGKDYKAYGPTGIKVRQTAAKAIRTEIDRVLEEKGEPGVREFNRRWGALDNIKTRAQEKAVQEALRESKQGKVPDWVKPYLFLHPDWGVLTGISTNLSKLRRTPAERLESGMEELGRAKLEPPPNPPFRLVPPPGRGIGPEQLGLPQAESPLEPTFRQRGRNDVAFPKSHPGNEPVRSFGESEKGFPKLSLKKGDEFVNRDGTVYVYNGKAWVKKSGLPPVPKPRSTQ